MRSPFPSSAQEQPSPRAVAFVREVLALLRRNDQPMTTAQLLSVVAAYYGNPANLLVREGNEICFVLGFPGLALGESIDPETLAQLKPLDEWAFYAFPNAHSCWS